MAKKIIIDIETDIKSVAKDVEKLDKSIQKAEKSASNLNKTSISLNNTKAHREMDSIKSKAEQLAKQRYVLLFDVIDLVSPVLSEVQSKAAQLSAGAVRLSLDTNIQQALSAVNTVTKQFSEFKGKEQGIAGDSGFLPEAQQESVLEKYTVNPILPEQKRLTEDTEGSSFGNILDNVGNFAEIARLLAGGFKESSEIASKVSGVAGKIEEGVKIAKNVDNALNADNAHDRTRYMGWIVADLANTIIGVAAPAFAPAASKIITHDLMDRIGGTTKWASELKQDNLDTYFGDLDVKPKDVTAAIAVQTQESNTQNDTNFKAEVETAYARLVNGEITRETYKQITSALVEEHNSTNAENTLTGANNAIQFLEDGYGHALAQTIQVLDDALAAQPSKKSDTGTPWDVSFKVLVEQGQNPFTPGNPKFNSYSLKNDLGLYDIDVGLQDALKDFYKTMIPFQTGLEESARLARVNKKFIPVEELETLNKLYKIGALSGDDNAVLALLGDRDAQDMQKRQYIDTAINNGVQFPQAYVDAYQNRTNTQELQNNIRKGSLAGTREDTKIPEFMLEGNAFTRSLNPYFYNPDIKQKEKQTKQSKFNNIIPRLGQGIATAAPKGGSLFGKFISNERIELGGVTAETTADVTLDPTYTEKFGYQPDPISATVEANISVLPKYMVIGGNRVSTSSKAASGGTASKKAATSNTTSKKTTATTKGTANSTNSMDWQPNILATANKNNLWPYYSYRANGGFVSGRQLSWVGEEGAEAIIPLVPARRQRGKELWYAAGRYLGILENASGSIVGTPSGGITSIESVRTDTTVVASASSQPAKVEVGGVQIVVNSSGDGSIEKVIEQEAPNIAKRIAGILNTALTAQYANTPLKGGA